MAKPETKSFRGKWAATLDSEALRDFGKLDKVVTASEQMLETLKQLDLWDLNPKIRASYDLLKSAVRKALL